MADHFYAGNPGEGFEYRTDTITVGTSASSTQKLELRITDGAVTQEQVVVFLEKLRDYFATRNQGVVVAGTLIG